MGALQAFRAIWSDLQQTKMAIALHHNRYCIERFIAKLVNPFPH